MYETHFDPETLSALRGVFDRVVGDLPHDQQTSEHKAFLAARILDLYATGLQDLHRLRVAALIDVGMHDVAAKR